MKLCDRNYATNSMLAVIEINGINCCPNCRKPAITHGKSIEQRALFWALSGDTGVSSEAICAHMTGNASSGRPPADASDRGRCIRLLELIPEWIPRLPEMLQYDQPEVEPTLTISNGHFSTERDSWRKQIQYIKIEGDL